MARQYELKRRAERQADTRRRIVEAAVDLHGTIGPARTTITDIARRAGVQRHTVYRHFPTERDIFLACSGHFAEQNPMPDERAWRALRDGGARVRLALDELYAFYERNEGMLTCIVRDADSSELTREIATLRRQPKVDAMRDVLVSGFARRGARRERIVAAVEVAIDFTTWRTLARRRALSRAAAVETMARAVEAQ